MEKLVVKTAVRTVLILLGVVVVEFAIVNFAFPQYMATVSESMGNYDLAVKYASLRYHYTRNCDDLARCFDDSVLSGNDKYILQYGEPLVEHRDYSEVCRDKDERQMGSNYSYDNWVQSRLAIAYYNTDQRSKGINLAADVNGTTSFAYGNPLMSLVAYIRSGNDVEAATYVLEKLNDIHPTDSTEKDYLTEAIAAMNGVKAKG